jgi:hypothetical protein
MASEGPIDPVQQRLAERRLVDALRRFHRRAPLRPDVRVDAVIAELHAAEPARPSGHRGRQALGLTDAELRGVVDGLVRAGTMQRRGHRVWLAEAPPELDRTMSARVVQLLATLREAGATPPPAEAIAKRLGIPVALLDQLRASGELVSAGPRIDYSRDGWATIVAGLDRLAAMSPLSVRLVRDQLGTTRRHAEAILRHWNRARSTE